MEQVNRCTDKEESVFKGCKKRNEQKIQVNS